MLQPFHSQAELASLHHFALLLVTRSSLFSPLLVVLWLTVASELLVLLSLKALIHSSGPCFSQPVWWFGYLKAHARENRTNGLQVAQSLGH
jgi:hypothetical protein